MYEVTQEFTHSEQQKREGNDPICNHCVCFAGTRFRPLSFEVPKPLFPVAGVPMLQHHIEACARVSVTAIRSGFHLVCVYEGSLSDRHSSADCGK